MDVTFHSFFCLLYFLSFIQNYCGYHIAINSMVIRVKQVCARARVCVCVWSILWCLKAAVATSSFIIPLLRTLRGLPYLGTVNNTAVNMDVQIFLQDTSFILFTYIPRSGIAGSYGSSIFNFLRNSYTVFHDGFTNLHCTDVRVPFSLNLCQLFVISYLLIIVILTGVRLCLMVIFIFISL